MKLELKNNNMDNIIKEYIHKTIKIIQSKYTSTMMNKIYERAFNYSYENIEKEIRDRIIFLRN